MSPTRRPMRPSSPAPRPGRAARGLPSSAQAQPGRVGHACRSRDGGAVLGAWRAVDDRRLVPSSDEGDAPALGPGILQLRAVAGDDRTWGAGLGAGEMPVDLATDRAPGRRLVPG